VASRANTAETSGFLDAAEQPEYGVLSSWAIGHQLRYRARRPMVVDNFGDDVAPENFIRVQTLLGARAEGLASSLLDELGAHYLVLDRRSVAALWRAFPEALAMRLFVRDGTELAHFRLVYDVPGRVAGQPPGAVPLKIFQHVRGATLRGYASAGSTVKAKLTLLTNRDRRIEVEFSTMADDQGAFSLGVPHATGRSGSLATSRYALSANGAVIARLAVAEKDVLEGQEIFVEGADARSLARSGP
jgi:dolichyl-diphosphooligosaccharide--protein glycosyltransferase